MGKQKNYLLLVLKGCAMGAADVVPGVSGGTIAFITGIYEELIDSIKSIDLQALKLLLSLKFADFWKKINGSFLLGVAGGIAISIFSLAKLMTWLLEHLPIYIWSFFFGLIVASSVLVAKEIKHWHIGTVISLIAGGCIAYVITVMSPAETPNTWWFIILSGAIAICAMILPGISGAFILLAPKFYHELLVLCPYVDTVRDRDNLDKTMKEDIYISTILGKYHQPCSGAHIFASQHQIDSILDYYNKKNISNTRKEIVLSLDDIDKKKVDGFIESNNLTSKVVLIHPNEGVPNRTWPKASWEALIELFLNDGWSVVLIGANNNFYTHKKTGEFGSSRVFNAIDKFTMGETVYLMSRSSLLVACDSGPVALAAATDIAICGLYSVVPGKYRLPYRHGILGWNALAINLSCQYVHCAKYYPLDTRGTFDAWCPNNKTYSCIEKYKVNDFYREINRFLDSKKFIDQLPDYI